MSRTHHIHSFATRFALAACALVLATGTATARICVTSDASAAVYDDGLQNGDNDANGFGPWELTPVSDNPADNRFLVESSVGNGDGVDDNRDGDVDTGNPGRAWGISAANGGQGLMDRPIEQPVGVGGSVSFSYDNGPVVGVQNNFALANPDRSILMFFGVGSEFSQYVVVDALGQRSTGVPNAADSGEGIHVEIELTSAAGDYLMTITTLADGVRYPVPGRFQPRADLRVALIGFNNNNNGPDAANNLYVNSLAACQPDLTGVYKIRSEADDKLWHENGLGDRLVSTRFVEDDPFVRFAVQERASDGSYRIRSLGTGDPLRVDSGDRLLSTRENIEDDRSRFFIESRPNGTWTFRVKETGEVLHYNGDDDLLLSTRAQPDDEFIRFFLDPVDVPEDLVTTPVVINHSAQCLDGGAASQPGSRLTQRTCTKDRDQRFTLRQLDARTHHLVEAATGYCVDILEGPGGIQMQPCRLLDRARQRFKLIDTQDGYHAVQNEATSECLDIPGASLTSGTNIIDFACQEVPSPNRRFLLDLTGAYKVRSALDGKAWHSDGFGDLLVSTRFQPDDDFVRFILDDRRPDGSYRIRVAADDRELGVLPDAGQRLTSAFVEPEAARRFHFVPGRLGVFAIQVQETGRFLNYGGMDDEFVDTAEQTGDDREHFTLQRSPVVSELQETPLIAKHSGLCLTVPAPGSIGSRLIQDTCVNGSPNQEFVLRPLADGSVQLIIAGTGLCLVPETIGQGSLVATRVCELADEPLQRFRLFDQGDGTNTFVNEANGLCFDVIGISPLPGAGLLMFPCGEPPQDNRRFVLGRMFDDRFETAPVPQFPPAR